MRRLPPSQPEASELGALSRQLEGGLEVLEAAAARYRELSATLLAGSWKRRLRQAPTLVAETLAEEPSLAGLLTRLQQRAEREPEGAGPASRFLRQFEEERTRLWRAMGRRLSLSEETLSLSGGTLAERLMRLQAMVINPQPLPSALWPLAPGRGEPLLLEGTGVVEPLMAATLTVAPWLGMPLLLLSMADSPHPLGWLIAGGVSLASWAFSHVRSGHYWLTSKRLVWKPRWGEPAELQLSEIEEGAITVNSWNTVKVHGPGGLALRHVPHATQLAQLLWLRSRKEFQGAAVTKDPRRLFAVLTMSSTRPGEPLADDEGADSWTAVLRPGFVAFFSRDVKGEQLLEAMLEPSEPTRSRHRVPIYFGELLEQLRLLPEERMDALLRKAATSFTGKRFWQPQAFLWETQELEWSWRGAGALELSRGDQAMVASRLYWLENQAAQQLVTQWEKGTRIA